MHVLLAEHDRSFFIAGLKHEYDHDHADDDDDDDDDGDAAWFISNEEKHEVDADVEDNDENEDEDAVRYHSQRDLLWVQLKQWTMSSAQTVNGGSVSCYHCSSAYECIAMNSAWFKLQLYSAIQS